MTAPTPGEWKVETAASRVGFTSRFLGLVRVRGRFEGFGGAVHVAPDPTRSSGTGTVEATTVTTGASLRDRHVRSWQFLSVRRHPSISFRSTSVGASTADDRFAVGGELTVRGVTQPVVLTVTVDVAEPTRIRLSGETTLDRTLYGVGRWMPFVSRRIAVDLDVTLVPA